MKKNKKDFEFIIKTQQDLILRMLSLNDWHLEANKKVMHTETDNWYLRWKVDYLEKKIKEHLPNIALYNKDDMLFDQIKKEQQHDKN
jgi:ABC-type microcin C transport system permease subunit YejE|tara:strand:- start:235 stop:495 length:261 start_codon:yes stop_codon:yes gene_type:complete